MTRWLIALFASLLLLSPASSAQCLGCQGGASAMSTSNQIGWSVSISVQVTSGECFTRWGISASGLTVEGCAEGPCSLKVTRSWSGLPPNRWLDFCSWPNGQRRCVDPAPTAGDHGSGSAVEGPTKMACGSGPTVHAIQVTGSSFEAHGTASCSDCFH